MKDNLTVYDIAKMAGVSVATVSRVLNNSDRVAESTKEKIKTIIDKYDFKPNEVARSLCKKETKLIGSVLPDITNPYYSMVVLEAERYALKRGYTMSICNTFCNSSNACRAIKTMAERQVDGIIYMGGERRIEPCLLDTVRNYSSRIPFVLINWKIEDSKCYNVRSDENQGFQMALNEVIRKQYKDVALIAGCESVLFKDSKIKLYKEAVQKGYFKEEIIYITQYTLVEGMEAMLKLLDRPKRPQAVIAVNDILAIGAINGCYRRGLRVPEDIAVIGYDNITYTESLYPTITTVAHDYNKIAKQAVSIITDKALQKSGVRDYVFPMELIRRESL